MYIYIYIYILKNNGPRTDPCGTPNKSSVQLLKLALTFVIWQ